MADEIEFTPMRDMELLRLILRASENDTTLVQRVILFCHGKAVTDPDVDRIITKVGELVEMMVREPISCPDLIQRIREAQPVNPATNLQDQRLAEMRQRVQAEQSESLLGADEAEYVQPLVTQFALKPLVLGFEGLSVSTKEVSVRAEAFPGGGFIKECGRGAANGREPTYGSRCSLHLD